MRANKLKQIWAAGGASIDGWLSLPSPVSAELMAHQGYDSLTIDLQHGLMDYQVALGMLQAISTTDVVPLARPPFIEEGILGKLLDAGAMGLICPMVNTRTDCERFVAACRYPPLGARSHGPMRAFLYAGADYFKHANSEVALLAMIETKEAVANLSDILSVPGLDGIYIGPSDLAISLGLLPSLDPSDKTVRAAIAEVLKVTRANNKIAAIHCGDPPFALEMIAQGFQHATVGSDARHMTLTTKAKVAVMRDSLGKAAGGKPQ